MQSLNAYSCSSGNLYADGGGHCCNRRGIASDMASKEDDFENR